MFGLSLDDEPVLLDGGLATELESRGHDLRDPLWSARLLEDAPEEIHDAHRAFFAAGARIATTASYQASRAGFARRGIAGNRTTALLRRSVELARSAGEKFSRRCWVAASVGPYGAVLADGSEYRGRYGLTARQLRDFHRPRIEALTEAEPDLLALETVPDIDEAAALVDVATATGIPCWLSYTVDGGRTRAGQDLHEAFSVARDNNMVIAVGVNCATPADATAAVSQARTATDKPVVVYPNSGESWAPRAARWVGPARFDTRMAHRWRADGARLIGGCCRVGPDPIAALARELDATEAST